MGSQEDLSDMRPLRKTTQIRGESASLLRAREMCTVAVGLWWREIVVWTISRGRIWAGAVVSFMVDDEYPCFGWAMKHCVCG